MEVLSIRCETTHSLHLLLDNGKANDPNSHIRIGKGRWPTSFNKTEHLNKLKLDLTTNHLGTMGVESM